MMRSASLLLIVGLLGAGSGLGHAATFPDKPPSQDFFVDEANLLAPAERSAINKICKELLMEEKAPLYVVTIPSLVSKGAAAYTVEKYAYELFNHWGIGFQDRNYGMLLLVSKGDRKARIELGSDWGHSHNSEALEVMNGLIVPQFKRGEFSKGILAGVEGLSAVARGLELPKPKQPWWILPLFIGGIVLIIGVIVNLFKTGRSGWGWALLAGLGVLLFFLLRSSGGSGGGFGGGSSGGGGASGSW